MLGYVLCLLAVGRLQRALSRSAILRPFRLDVQSHMAMGHQCLGKRPLFASRGHYLQVNTPVLQPPAMSSGTMFKNPFYFYSRVLPLHASPRTPEYRKVVQQVLTVCVLL